MAAADVVASSIPVGGDFKDAQEALTGRNLVTGQKLTGFERVVTIGAAAVPVVGGAVLRKAANSLVDAVKGLFKGGKKAGNATGACGGAVKGTTGHAVNQKINRGVRSADELDALKNPLKKGPVKVDSQGRNSQRMVGEKAEVVVNPDTHKIVSVNPTSSKKAARLKKQRCEEGQ